jgi:predicted RNase H-like nuclease
MSYAAATATNLRITGKGLSQQAWGIAPKIKEVDDTITPENQQWVFEVHPEVSFWALAGEHPMAHGKKTKAGLIERLDVLRPEFPDIEVQLQNRPAKAGKDDLLDAAVAAWTAMRICRGEARPLCKPSGISPQCSVLISGPCQSSRTRERHHQDPLRAS